MQDLKELKFKIGDKVRLINEESFVFEPIGTIGVVVQIDRVLQDYGVRFGKENNNRTWWIWECNLELVKEEN